MTPYLTGGLKSLKAYIYRWRYKYEIYIVDEYLCKSMGARAQNQQKLHRIYDYEQRLEQF